MRIKTIVSAAILGLSSAVIAQVTTSPQQKPGTAPDANDMAVAANTVAPSANDTTPVPTDTPDGNASNAAPPAGEPDAASSAPPKR